MEFAIVRAIFQNSPLCRQIPEAVSAGMLYFARPRRFAKGDIIFRQGEHSNHCFYLILSGVVNVIDEPSRTVFTSCTTGNLLGEVAVLSTKQERTATLAVVEDCELLEWDMKQLPGALWADLTPHLERIAFERIASN